MAYFEKPRAMPVPAKAGLALLDLAPDVRAGAKDAAPNKARGRR